MSKNPFVVLGLSRDATQAEVEEAYTRLKEDYRMQTHMEGDEGRKAAKKLAEIESAYVDAMASMQSNIDYDTVYAKVEALLQKNKIEEAQYILDQMSERNAEWHYLQSAVYHRKGWAFEAKAQLEMAINMDSDNEKYKMTMEKLKAKQGGAAESSASVGGEHTNQRSYQTYDEMQASQRRKGAGDCCCYLIWADCCCECMGGDLIRCC